MSNGKRAPTKLKNAQCCSVAKTTDYRQYQLGWNTFMNNWALCISREMFSCKTWLWVNKIKMNKQVAHHKALSYSSSPHHHLHFSISSLLQSWWFTSAPPCNTLLAQILTIKSSQKKMWMMTTKSMPYIRLTSNTTVKTSAVCSYHSSMSMIEKNAKY